MSPAVSVRRSYAAWPRRLAEEIERLRAEPAEGDIAIGGATLAAEAAALGLIDEYRARVYRCWLAVAFRSAASPVPTRHLHSITASRRVVDHGEAADWPGAAALRCSCVEREGRPDMTDPEERGQRLLEPRPPTGVPCGPRAGDELLKAAFVQDRLTQDELDTRVGLALVSRTYADLADITADIPSGSAAAERAAEPAGTPARTLAKAVRRSGICMLIAFALVGVVALIGEEAWAPPGLFPWGRGGHRGVGLFGVRGGRRLAGAALPQAAPAAAALGRQGTRGRAARQHRP
jgi:hypothetical protein